MQHQFPPIAEKKGLAPGRRVARHHLDLVVLPVHVRADPAEVWGQCFLLEDRLREQVVGKFFELAALAVDAKAKGREVTLTLTDFVIPPDDVPEEVRGAVKHWSQ